MQYLIEASEKQLDESGVVHFLDFVRVEKNQQIKKKEVKPRKPPSPEEPPPEPPAPQLDDVNPSADAMAVSSVPVSTEISLDGFGISRLAAADGEYLPIVKVQPMYPRRALSRGIEGYVIVEFTVTKQGTTRDHLVVEAKPSGIFDKAAIAAAAKFKYKPRVVDGQPIEVPGVRNKITFQIED
ncbi:MAG: TonB family protein [Gammaproteobacteria bacterium]|nr:TonB family protein [Gammaproteobacteria bacterium]